MTTPEPGKNPFETPDPYEPFSVEIQVSYVDPMLLNMLIGGAPYPEQVYGIELYIPIKRTFWQWLRRSPRQYKRVYIPRAILEGP